jgi:hypothetical protein
MFVGLYVHFNLAACSGGTEIGEPRFKVIIRKLKKKTEQKYNNLFGGNSADVCDFYSFDKSFQANIIVTIAFVTFDTISYSMLRCTVLNVEIAIF